jgi:hypothetical protein
MLGNDSHFNVTIIVDNGYVTKSYGWVNGEYIESPTTYIPDKKLPIDPFINLFQEGIKVSPALTQKMSIKVTLTDPKLSILDIDLYNVDSKTFVKPVLDGNTVNISDIPNGKYQIVVKTEKGLLLHNILIHKAV